MSATVRTEVSHELVEAITPFLVECEVEHCRRKFSVLPFGFYATCAQYETRMKLRALSGVTELEDVFDAVFEWMNDPTAWAIAGRRQAEIVNHKGEWFLQMRFNDRETATPALTTTE